MRARAIAVAVLCCVWMVSVQSAASAAAVPAPRLAVDSFAVPTNFSPGGQGSYEVFVTNVGSVATDGSQVTVTDVLPAGVTVQSIEFFDRARTEANLAPFLCETSTVRCRFPGPFGFLLGSTLPSDGKLKMVVHVTVDENLLGQALSNTVTASGGGAPDASVTRENGVATALAPFGASNFDALFSGVDGAPDVQAAGHPYELATTIGLDNGLRAEGPETQNQISSVKDVRDIAVDLPLGFVGSAMAAPRCAVAELTNSAVGGTGSFGETCSNDTIVGHLFTEPESFATVDSPIFNLVPERGVPVELGYIDVLRGVHVLYVHVVPTPAGYVVRAVSPDVPAVGLTHIDVTLYGNPASRAEMGGSQVPFFTGPSACTGAPLVTRMWMDSWQAPGSYNADGTPNTGDGRWVGSTSVSPPVTGCNELRFAAGLSARPETGVADSPSGFEADVKVPQTNNVNVTGTPPLRNATVALPAGLSVNPAAASGLGACSEAQIGLGSASAPSCPDDSKIGTVEVQSPAVASTLTGSIYLAAQNENPFHALLAGYIVIDDPLTGVVVKVPAELRLDPGSGQITGFVPNAPQFQISDVRLHFFGGPRAPLATPQACGTYTTTSDLMPWSAPDSGPDAMPSDAFQIQAGCTGAFNPGFSAGVQNTQADAYAPFVLSFSRQDGEQSFARVTQTLPEGLLGKIAGIPLCSDAHATAGTCPETSRVGNVNVGAGVGPNPFFTGGKAYLTGPYNGGPFGLVVEVPAVAGPFDLGMVVVRVSLRIDPQTAQVTAVSDPLPTILDGIPLHVRRVDVTLDRPGFTFNPTNCTPMSVTGALTSTQGATANVASRFQVGGCGELAFKPSFKVATQHNTSKRNGASLDVKVVPGQGQANIHGVAVTLPKALPSRLTTIQQACTEAQFAQNPAGCPAGSSIGVALAHTPVLANPVSGPVYLVSHGGAAFPDIVLVLQGEGVNLVLTGSVNIRHGITSSAFNQIPDAPISSFELKLPEGPHSGLAAVLPPKAKGSLCATSLTMPTTLTGQNGGQIKQNTKIQVAGCTKTKKTKTKKHRKGKKRK